MLSNVRPQDRVPPLIASGRITKAYADAWPKLRNRNVHPKQIDPQGMDKAEFQMIFDLINKTTTFMYEIIFHLIDYAGPHADYGQHGFPTRQYPINAGSAIPAAVPVSTTDSVLPASADQTHQ